ncbi:porin [Burkholderia sp. PAMC 26561]|uniref:porin n=1 Tax=Burkholderia sp. PAMC 26561 TaxID=1795043 RepID=UPI00076B7F33|nr:porin [Burkholderia sp. PAMC 26561]AME23719.1 porin [Burkholderia sp. PAMC 26561]
MKRVYIAVSACVGIVGSAHAQSNVTLYGIVDAGFLYSNNSGGQKLYETSGGNIQGSRWGLKGSEDLGGGLSAIFDLQNGFNAFTGRLGQGGDEFGRTAYVGLSSARYGAVTLGRQYDSVVDYVGPFMAADQWMSFYGAHPGDLDNMNNTNRVNNSVKYANTIFNGLSFGGLYSLGGVAGQFNRNQIFSLGGKYAQGPISFAASYLNVKDPNYSFFGNNATSNTATSNMTGSRVYSGYASAKTQQVIAAAAAYNFGAATVGATYSNTQFKDIGTEAGLPRVGAGGAAKYHNAEANFKYQLSPALVLGVAYDYTKGYGVNDAKYHQGMLGVDYFLSKRTDLHLNGVFQHASGRDSTGTTAVANIAGLSASSTSNQTAVIAGIRHKF